MLYYIGYLSNHFANISRVYGSKESKQHLHGHGKQHPPIQHTNTYMHTGVYMAMSILYPQYRFSFGQSPRKCFAPMAPVAPTTRLRIMHAFTDPASHHARVPCSVLLAPPWQWLGPRPGRLVGLASPWLWLSCLCVGLCQRAPRDWRWRLCCATFASHSSVRPAGLQFNECFGF